MGDQLLPLPPTERSVHLCVDMQRIFWAEGPWPTPWMERVLDAADIGYRVIVVRDAICSSSDEGREMLMRLYHTRYTEQIETADAETILSRWA